MTRRAFQASLAALPAAVAAASPAAEQAMPTLSESFPTQPVELVLETVTVAHGNVKRLKELVDARPSLAKAAYDWGFGDWEDALGAASHVGNREIAEYLIAKGARPTLYSATMLGQLEVVRAFVTAQPGCQRIPGPHSIPLLSHAKMGGVAAEPVLRYLESLGDAGSPAASPITAEEVSALTGTYVFGPGPRDSVGIAVARGQLMFTRKGTSAHGLVHVGGLSFFPTGASAVRVRFTLDKSLATLTVHDPDPVLIAKKL